MKKIIIVQLVSLILIISIGFGIMYAITNSMFRQLLETGVASFLMMLVVGFALGYLISRQPKYKR